MGVKFVLAAHQEVLKLGLLHPPGEISFAAIEAAVLDVAHYDTFHLSAAILGGQRQKVQRMIDSLRAAGTPEVRVHWAIADDIGAIARPLQDAPVPAEYSQAEESAADDDAYYDAFGTEREYPPEPETASGRRRKSKLILCESA